MGHLALADLSGIADALIRALNWITDSDDGDIPAAIDRLCQQLAEAEGDMGMVQPDLPPELTLGPSRRSLGQRVRYETELWTKDEVARRDAIPVWYLLLGQRIIPFAEFRVVTYLGPWPFVVVMKWDPLSQAERFDWSPLETLSSSAAKPLGIRMAKAALKALDVLGPHPIVVIDPTWKEPQIRETVMAQIIEWIVRVDDSAAEPDLSGPHLASDVYDWWLNWANKTARRTSQDPLSLSDVYEVAKRSLQPRRAAGHRAYWRESLMPRAENLITRAAAIGGVSPRTAYERLKRGSKRVADFPKDDSELDSVVAFLGEQAPAVRSLPEKSRLIINALCESGMKENSARKLERRIRKLPPEEQAERLSDAVKRATKS